MKWELVDTLACSPAFVVDYWGCYAEVFNGHPEGSISSSAYFPQNQEEQFLLLAPQHIDQMLSSLWKHRDDLTAMTGEDIAKLETIKQKCAEDQSFRAAYWFDF